MANFSPGVDLAVVVAEGHSAISVVSISQRRVEGYGAVCVDGCYLFCFVLLCTRERWRYNKSIPHCPVSHGTNTDNALPCKGSLRQMAVRRSGGISVEIEGTANHHKLISC